MNTQREDFIQAPSRTLIELDKMHRQADSLLDFLKNSDIHPRQWREAIAMTSQIVELQDYINSYFIQPDSAPISGIREKLRKLLKRLGKLIFFDMPNRLTHHSLFLETQIQFSLTFYRYQGFERTIRLFVLLNSLPVVNDFEAIIARINESGRHSPINMVVVLGDASKIRRAQQYYDDYSILMLDELDLRRLVFSEDARSRFTELVVRDIDRRKIQPYSHTDIRVQMFVGREQEIQQIVTREDISFAIYGPRRIGKTFVLWQVYRHFSRSSGYHVTYFSFQGKRAEDIIFRLLKEIGVETSQRTVQKFEDMLRNYIQSRDEKFVFLFDEVDDLISEQRQTHYNLILALRNLRNEFRSKCRFVFAGFQTLASEFQNIDSPFHNFVEKIKLGSLNDGAAIKLIEQPLEQDLKFRLHPRNEFIQLLLRRTLRHPALIQYMGARLVEYACESGRDSLQLRDIEACFYDWEYRSMIARAFWYVLEKRQQYILLQLLQFSTSVNVAQVKATLARSGIVTTSEAISEHLAQMTVAGILREDGEGQNKRFVIADELLREILVQNDDVQALVDELRGSFNVS